MDFVPEHYIDRHMLKVLTQAKTARYSELRPPGVDSNLFNYHRKVLLEKDFIQKTADNAYTLTPRGLRYAESASISNMRTRLMPKVCVSFVLKNHKGEIAFLDKTIQPFVGKVNLPNGKLHFDDVSAELGAKRTLSEIALGPIELSLLGIAEVSVHHSGNQIVHTIHFMYGARLESNQITSERLYWLKARDIIPKQAAPWVVDMVKDFNEHTAPVHKFYYYKK